MNLLLKERLLNTTQLEDFQTILKNSDIKDTKELDKDVLKHFCTLGNGDCSYNHEDPRKKK